MRLSGLAIRMLLDAPFKSLGTLIGVVVSVFLMLQQLSLLTGILGRVSAFADSTDVDVWVASAATESTDATDSIPASRVQAAAGTQGVAWAEPVVQGLGRVTRPDGVREFVKVLGVRPPRYAGLPRTLVRGTPRDSLRASDRVLMNWNDRKTFASAEVGDRVEIDGNAAVVAGFFEGMDPHNPYYYFYANIDDARGMTSFPQDRVTFVAVGLEPGASIDDVKHRLAARIPDVTVLTRQDLHDAELRYFLTRQPVGMVFGMGTVIAALIGGAIVAVTLYSTVIDRTREYGMLKAIGARRGDLRQLLLMQAWSFASIGFGIGAGAFFAVRALFASLPMKATPEMVAGVGVAALLSCTLASFAAVQRVLTLDPAIVFKG
jgi:putative ABC transport system permease protein